MSEPLFLLAGVLLFCVVAGFVVAPLLKKVEASRKHNQALIQRDSSSVAAWRITDLGAIDVNAYRLEARLTDDQCWRELDVANAAQDLEGTAVELRLSPELRII